MIVRIELPDDVGAALQVQAAAQGLSLETWLKRLAEQRPPKRRYTLAELVQQCDSGGPLSDEDREWMEAPPVGREAL
jgi:antitoxin ChpS